jgi:hypothetical protein
MVITCQQNWRLSIIANIYKYFIHIINDIIILAKRHLEKFGKIRHFMSTFSISGG